MRVLLTGASGQVGGELAQLLPQRFAGAHVIALDRAALDLTDAGATIALVRAAAPDVIVNAAAYTALDAAESDPQTAYALNAQAPEVLAEEARQRGCLLIHYSTDYVFDGMAREPYTEESQPNPVSVYGASKLAGEAAVHASGCAHLILRTSWVYGRRGKNFLLTMRRLAAERPELRVVNDQWGVPNWSRLLAAATLDLLDRGIPFAAERSGLYHLSCRGATTWYEFARRLLGYPARPNIVPISTTQYPLPARRPAYAVLSGRKLEAAFGVVLPAWEAALADCLAGMDDQRPPLVV